MKTMPMRYRLPLALLIVAGTAVLAGAHITPIVPSTCAFDPVVLSVPSAQLSVTADHSTAADALRIDWDTGANRAKFCLPDPDPLKQCQTSRPRSFTLAGSPGTLTLPPAFNASMASSGDMRTAPIPVVLTWSGGMATAPVALTTGLAGAGATVVSGAPVAADGSLTLVGAASDLVLPSPFGGTVVALRMTCAATPPPDLDQFTPSPEVKSVGGTIKAGSLRLKVAFASAQPNVDFASGPALLQVTGGGATIASIVVPGGLTGKGRHRFTGTAADGKSVLSLHTSGRSTVRYQLTARTSAVTMPPAASSRADVAVTFDGGGLVARSTRAFRASHAGARLHAP